LALTFYLQTVTRYTWKTLVHSELKMTN
jgi:hypothetical protein